MPHSEFLKAEPIFGPENKPRAIADFDIRKSILEDLTLKTLYLSGSLSITELAEKTRLSFEVAQELSSLLRAEMLCQVTGMHGHIPQIAITSQGRSRAMDLLAQNHYAGSAPVTLQSYVEQTLKQSVRKVEVHEDEVKRAFTHLVIESAMLRQFGTALNSGSSIFLYGPPGTGRPPQPRLCRG